MLERRTRALEESLDVRLRSVHPYALLEVRNPLHGTSYLVMLPGFPRSGVALCTCTDFARRGLGTCKHIEAATRWYSDHADARPLLTRPRTDPAKIWAEVDLRARSSEREGSLLRQLRRVGAALYETE